MMFYLQKQRVDLMMAQYQANKSDLSSVLEARRALLDSHSTPVVPPEKLALVPGPYPDQIGPAERDEKYFSLTLVAVAISGITGLSARKPASVCHQPLLPASLKSHNENSRKVLYWYIQCTVPVNALIKPGKSPFMDMELVPRYASETVEMVAVDQRPPTAKFGAAHHDNRNAHTQLSPYWLRHPRGNR